MIVSNISLHFTILTILFSMSYSNPCQPFLNYTFYDLSLLDNPVGWQFSSAILDNEESKPFQLQNYFINYCSSLNIQQISKDYEGADISCSKIPSDTTVLYMSLTNNILSCASISTQNPTFAQVDKTNFSSGILADFSDPNYNSTILINMQCDPSTPWYSKTGNINGSSGFYAVVVSQYACDKFTIHQIWQFSTNYEYAFIPIFCIIGLFITFFGSKMIDSTLFISTTIGSLFIIMQLFFGILVTNSTNEYLKWTLFIIALLSSLIFGWLTFKVQKIGMLFLGAWLGFIISLIIWEIALTHLNYGEITFYTFLIIMTILGCLITIWIYKNITVIATALIGSYTFIRAISSLIGEYPNEFVVAQSIQNGQYVSIGWQVYAYFIFIIILTIGAVFFQYKVKKEDEEVEAEKNSHYYLSQFYNR